MGTGDVLVKNREVLSNEEVIVHHTHRGVRHAPVTAVEGSHCVSTQPPPLVNRTESIVRVGENGYSRALGDQIDGLRSVVNQRRGGDTTDSCSWE